MNYEQLSRKYLFTIEELNTIKNRFDVISSQGYMTKQQFRDSLGILGLEPYLSERIFNHIASTNLYFEDFVRYLSMLLNGTATEKALWSFRLLSNNKNILEIEDMERMIFEICYLWNSMTGSRSTPKKELVEEIFGIFDTDRDGMVSFDEFRVIYQEGVELIGWFEFLNNEDVNTNKIKAEWENQIKNSTKRKRITLVNRPSLEFNHQDLINQQLKFLQSELIGCADIIRQEKESQSKIKQNFLDFEFEVAPKSHGPVFNDREVIQMYGDDDPDLDVPQKDIIFNTISDRFQHQMMNKLRFILQLTEQIKKLNGQITTPTKSNMMEQSVVKKSTKQLQSQQSSSPLSVNQTQEPEEVHKNLSIYFGHENWNLVLNMMIGIRKAIKSLHPLSDDILLSNAHYEVKNQFEIIPKRTKEFNYKKSYHFYEYCPMIFERIRKMYNVTNEDFLKSIGPEQLLGDFIFGNLSTLTEKVSSGKSGSFFYYSSDDKYMLKTIQRDEFIFFKSIIKNYYKHMSDNFNTLIIKIFGLYKMKQLVSKSKAVKIYFVVMMNIFHTEQEITERYDLKGSLYQRTSRIKGKVMDPTIPLKDLDFLEDKQKIEMKSKQFELFRTQLSKDILFFVQNNIIDYSLLLGIVRQYRRGSNKSGQNQFKRFYEQDDGGILSGDGKQLYFVGIIDIFTEFNNKKLLEHKLKHTFISKDVSCIPPEDYAERFRKFILEAF